MAAVNSYKDLLIWQKGIKIVLLIYKLVKKFPDDERFALTSQLKRASVSIPSNIAEGFGRNTDKSFSYFLDIAKGSLNEIEIQLIISKELDFVKDETLFNKLILMIQEESKMIYSFSKTLKN